MRLADAVLVLAGRDYLADLGMHASAVLALAGVLHDLP
jgi:hypothetical protein